MAVLRNIEQKLESLFEGMFGRAFRTHVQPVELARKLVKEMDDHRMVSVSRVYVPNEYTVYLSTADRNQFSSYEESLQGELQEYLGEHARREGYDLLTVPAVLFETDDDLTVGEFGIATRLVQDRSRAVPTGAPPSQAQPGATMVYKPQAPPPAETVSAEELGAERRLVARELLAVARREVDRVLVRHVDARHGDHPVVVHLLDEFSRQLDRLDVRAERAAEDAFEDRLDLLLDRSKDAHGGDLTDWCSVSRRPTERGGSSRAPRIASNTVLLASERGSGRCARSS